MIRAVDKRIGPVAIKFVATRDDVARRRFRRELDFLRRVAHEKVGKILDGPFESCDGTLAWGVLELLEGGSLTQLRKNRPEGRLEERTIVRKSTKRRPCSWDAG